MLSTSLQHQKITYLFRLFSSVHSVQSLSRVWLFVTPWTVARLASPFITNSRSPPKPMSIVSVMPSNHLIFCCTLLLLPSIFPSIKVFSNDSALRIMWPKYWSFSFNISLSNEHPGLISFRMDWLDLLAVQGTLKSLLQHHSSKASTLRCSAFFIVQLSHPYMTTWNIIALMRWTFVGKVMSLPFNMLSRLVINFLPRRKTEKILIEVIKNIHLLPSFCLPNIQHPHPRIPSFLLYVWTTCFLESEIVLVTQSCPTLCDPMDCSLSGSSVHGSLQARILEWVAIPFSRESSWPRDQTRVFSIVGRFFTIWATREVPGTQSTQRFHICIVLLSWVINFPSLQDNFPQLANMGHSLPLNSHLFPVMASFLCPLPLLKKLLEKIVQMLYSKPSIWSSLVTQMVKNLPEMQETRVWSLGREDPLEKGMATLVLPKEWQL